jgi:hypothetical protein
MFDWEDNPEIEQIILQKFTWTHLRNKNEIKLTKQEKINISKNTIRIKYMYETEETRWKRIILETCKCNGFEKIHVERDQNNNYKFERNGNGNFIIPIKIKEKLICKRDGFCKEYKNEYEIETTLRYGIDFIKQKLDIKYHASYYDQDYVLYYQEYQDPQSQYQNQEENQSISEESDFLGKKRINE